MLVLLPIDTLPAFSNCRALVLRAKLNDIESIKYINTVISKKIGESAVFFKQHTYRSKQKIS